MTGSAVSRGTPVAYGRVRERLAWVAALLGLGLVVAAVVGSALGWSLLIFRSGSMSPDIPAGAAAISRPVAVTDVSPGDVVSVVSKTGDRITHRVVDVSVGDSGVGLLRLRGDANAGPDREVYRAATVDRVVTSLPLVGYPIAVALSPVGLVVLGCAALGLVVLAFGGERRGAGAGAHAARPPARRRTRRGATAAAATAAVVVAVGGTTGTLASFSDPATLTTGAYAANPYFTCASAVSGVASPYLWWRFDETQVGATADSSGNARPGLMVGDSSSIRRGTAACGRDTGGSLRFDGASSYVGQPSGRSAITAPNTYTAQVWFQTTTTRGGMLLGFGNTRTGSSNQHDRHLYLTEAGRLVYGVFPGSVRTLTSEKAYNDGDWHQAVTTLSSAGQRLYVDGELEAADASVTTGQGISGYWRVAYDNLDGWPNNPVSDYFAGTLDDVAIYTSALSAAQVRAGYRAGLTS